jgi:hypothetical protein
MVVAIFDIRSALEVRRHDDFVKEHFDRVTQGQKTLKEGTKIHQALVDEYEFRTNKDSRLPGTDCEADKKDG